MKHGFLYRLIRGFLLSSILVMTVVIVAGILLHQSAKTAKMDQYNSIGQKHKDIKVGRADDVSMNLLYVIDEEDELKELYLEIFHCKNRELNYISIPLDTTFTMSAKLYQKLSGINPKISQIITLKHLLTYFEENTYAYSSMILDELLEIDSSYYTVITLQDQSYIEYFNQLKGELNTKKEIKQYVKDIYTDIETNLSKKDKLSYVEYYAGIEETAQFYDSKGVKKNEYFELNRVENRVFITNLCE